MVPCYPVCLRQSGSAAYHLASDYSDALLPVSIALQTHAHPDFMVHGEEHAFIRLGFRLAESALPLPLHVAD